MPNTCDQGLTERFALPAKLSALSAAMADNLDAYAFYGILFSR